MNSDWIKTIPIFQLLFLDFWFFQPSMFLHFYKLSISALKLIKNEESDFAISFQHHSLLFWDFLLLLKLSDLI